MDDQHKGLINITNDLFNHATENEEEERTYFDGVVQQALDYVKNHFVTEEKCMLALKFPGYHEHKKTHDEFTFTVIKNINEFKTGKTLVLEKFADFLKEWILSHIAVMDKQYSQYFRKISAIKPDGKPGNALLKILNT
ncbi:MAG: hemerythrin family protein [Treponema sp.]|nr:hemerythrin family protein [Treponema sp.]MCL2271852.1 hemerythrin family protein [Treponema sp.]